MKIALIGASGFIGSAVLEEALMRGHEVTALVSNPAKLTGTDRLAIKKADARQTAALAEQLKGHDVVVSAFSGHGSDDVYGYYMEGFARSSRLRGRQPQTA